MNLIINRRTIYVLLLLLFAVGDLSVSAKKKDDNLKPWNTGPLTWSDYQTVELGERADYSSITDYVFKSANRKVRIDNYKIVYYSYDIFLNRSNSCYDPKKFTEWDLRADQVVFDILELHSRYIQNWGLGETTQKFRKIKERYEEKAQEQVDRFLQESDNGKDTSVVRKYEESIREELDRNPRKEPDLSLAGRVPGMLGLYFSYDRGMFLGESSGYFKPSNGLSYGLDFFSKKDWYFDFGLSLQFTYLKTGNYYWDSKYAYDWESGKDTDIFRLYLNIGHTVKSSQYFRLIPYAGISYSNLRQKSNSLNPKNNSYYLSDIDGFSVMAGMNADWMFRRTIRPDEVVDTSLRFKLYGAYDHFGSADKNLWSINLGVAINFDVKTYNTDFYIPIPIFF